MTVHRLNIPNPQIPKDFAYQHHATSGKCHACMLWVQRESCFACGPHSQGLSLWRYRHSKSPKTSKCKPFLVPEEIQRVVIHRYPVAQLEAEDIFPISPNKTQSLKPYHQIIKEQQSKCTIHEINIEQEDNLFFLIIFTFISSFMGVLFNFMFIYFNYFLHVVFREVCHFPTSKRWLSLSFTSDPVRINI